MLAWLRKKIEKTEFDRKVKMIRRAMGVSQDLREANDYGTLQTFQVETEMSDMNGFEENVKIARTEKGIMLIKESNGEPVSDVLSLSSENLQKVPSDLEEGFFIHLIIRSKYKGLEDKICSCLVDREGNFYGDARAFWWSLAQRTVRNMFVAINHTRMTSKAFEQVRAAANGIWQSAIDHDGSIDNMRDTLAIAR